MVAALIVPLADDQLLNVYPVLGVIVIVFNVVDPLFIVNVAPDVLYVLLWSAILNVNAFAVALDDIVVAAVIVCVLPLVMFVEPFFNTNVL